MRIIFVYFFFHFITFSLRFFSLVDAAFSVGYHDVAFVSSVDKRKLGQLKAARVADPFYDDCGQTKTCFGSPDGCLATQDCVAVTAVKVEGTRYIFEMKAKNAAYVAVGISDDQKMVS